MKNIINIYSLSPLQEGMLFHSLYDEDDENSQSYFSQMKLRLNGKLDIAMFEKAWKEVIKRHDILRTKFLFGKTEKNVQVVYRTVPFNVDYTDWRSFSREEQESKIEEFLRLDKQRGFDWDDVPLMRVMLIHNDIDEYTMVWSHHHILLDGWSVSLVVKELFHIYNALCQEATITLPPAQQYGKYIHWLRSRSKDSQNTKEFWATKLKGFTEPTQFNLAAPMKGFDQQGYEEYWWHLSKDLTHSLNHIVKEHKITLNTIIQSAWALLLSYYSGTKDVLFGATSSGRPADLPGVENMVGLFISTLPVRAQIPDDEVLLEWMKNFQSQLMEIRQYEYSSLVDIQGVSEVPRGTPLFESLFVFENYPVGEMESITDLRIEEIQGKEQANYPFVLSAGPGEQIPFKIMFDRSKFDEDTIHRISGQLTYVLDQIAKNPNATISSIQFLTEKETKQILVDWNDTAGEYPREKTIHELFEEQVSLKPDGIALETEDGAVTYRELNESANQIAHYLIEQGIEIGDPIGICMNRSLEEIASMLGILKVGGAYVGLDPEYPEERLKHIVEETEMPLLLTTSQSGLDEAAYDVDIVNIDLLDLPEEKTNIFREGISATALSNIIYTSGSTGKPKGVCVPHRGVVRLVKGETYVPITSDDVFLHVASISFDATTLEVWSSLLNGARLVLLPTRNASLQDYENVIQKHNVSILWLTAGLFNVFVDHNLQALKGVKYLLIGGETVSVPHVRKAMEALEGTEIINGYGPSENTVFTTCHRIEEADLERPSIPIGRPIANTEVYVLDENQQPVPVGVIGELYAGGDGLAIGYMNRPELTAERFIPHPFKQGSGEKLYRTGDLVRYLPDGKIEFIGRADHQVKIRGFRIELGEIEVVLKQYPDVRDAVVTTFEDGTGDKKLIAYLITDGVVEDREIREYTQGRLPNYMIPWKFMFLSEFPLTKNGKVDRKSLPIPFDRPSESYVEPKTKLERKFVELWERVLGRKNVGTHDNFFELGGHSLLATKLVFVINEELGYNITLRQLFEKPTIVGMIQSLENKTEERSMEEILKKDIFLDKEIDKQIQQAKRVNTRFNSILLTGATGFLGAYMLRDLLNETDATIYCLVRGKGYEDGFNRIKNNLMKYALWDERYKQQIIPLIGDLSQDSLGLSVDTWRELENKIDMIYHTGADVNFMMPYEESKYTNVYGTKEIIRLASSKKIKPIHYVSTLSVFTLSPDGESMLVSEDMEPRVNEGLSIGYTQSKCVAENVITLARNKGLPISIYRPGRISGDSTTGRVNESDLLWRLVRGCIELGKAPEMDGNEVEMTPVDMISKSIICLSVDESTQNGTFHLFNNNKISFESITQEMKSQYASLEVVGIAEWLEALEADARKQSKNAMSPLVHLLKEGILEAEAIQFENSKTMDQLEKYGITYPKPTRKMIKKSIQYFSETGVLQNVEQV